MPGPLVETGSTLVVVWEVVTRAGDAFGDGDGEGEGETDGDGDGDGAGASGVASTTTTGMFVAACALFLLLNPR